MLFCNRTIPTFSSITMPVAFIVLFLILASSGFIQIAYSGQSVLQSLDEAPVAHFTLARRGGTFEATRSGNDSVEMGLLLEQLEITEAKFNLTRREVKGNKLVRKAKSQAIGGRDDDGLIGNLALNGSWSAACHSLAPCDF